MVSIPRGTTKLIHPPPNEYTMRSTWRRARARDQRGVAEILGALLLVALTLIAGAILWGFHFNLPPSPPNVGFVLRSGGSNPVWGDPTDQGPNGYSLLNTSEIIVASHSPQNIPLTEITLTFVCNGYFGNATAAQGGSPVPPIYKGSITTLITGSLASMSWVPGLGTYPTSGPKLGHCANFNAGGFGGGAFGTFFNRLGLFEQINPKATVLENGDTFILYIHNGGYPLDYGYCGGSLPVADCDDYHGAPPWCFQDAGACTILLTYTGIPNALLASIPVLQLAPPASLP